MARKTRVRNNRPGRLQRRKSAPASNCDSFKELCSWFLPDGGIFSHIKFHGNIKWTPVFLVWLALCWAWMDARFLTDAFSEARECCQKIFGCTPLKTYPSFIWALVTQTANFMPVLREIMHERMEQIGGKFWRVEGWVPIAFDGSRSSAPRSSANEKSLCAANYGKGKTAKYRKKKSKGMRRKRNKKNKATPPKPQAWITLLWHMSLRQPWSWRLGPSDASERDHVMEMVREETFPKNTLFCGDAGFVGYSLWARILEQECDFLIRVGANVNLLLEQTDYTVEKAMTKKDKLVLCWPKTMQAKHPPLRLRLVQIRLGKKSPAWILTSVRDPERLSVATVLRLYTMRWGIEVEFRGLKQTLDRAKLRSRNDRNLFAELNWSILAMAVAELFALKEQLTQRVPKKSRGPTKPIDPIKRSLADTMRAIRSCLRDLHGVPEPDRNLASKLRAATTDGYRRKSSKQARYRPKNPDKKKLGDPNVRRLSAIEKRKLQRIPDLQAA